MRITKILFVALLLIMPFSFMATLRIINGGIIETRSGFETPIGALVEILNGQII